MNGLLFGDLHIKPAGRGPHLDRLAVPDRVDVVLINDDLVDTPTLDSVADARAFLQKIVHDGVPVVLIPGNHDPHPQSERLSAELEGVESAHCRVVTDEMLAGAPGETERPLDGHAVVGYGCEQFDQHSRFDQTAFAELDPTATPRSERRYRADRTAQRVENAVYSHLVEGGELATAADELGIMDHEYPTFVDAIEAVADEYEHVTELIACASAPQILLTHVPPFNTAIDRHHSSTGRGPAEDLHVGSLGLKMAIRERPPFAILSGHSHEAGYEPGSGPDNRPHVLNPGYRGIYSVTVDGHAGTFSYDPVHTNHD